MPNAYSVFMVTLCLLMDLAEIQCLWLCPLLGSTATLGPLPQPSRVWMLSCTQSWAGPPPWGILRSGQKELHRLLYPHSHLCSQPKLSAPGLPASKVCISGEPHTNDEVPAPGTQWGRQL